MEIKPPSATAPITRESVTVRPSLPGSAAQPHAQAAATLRLSPAMFQVGQILEVMIARVEANALILMLRNPIIDEHGQRINLQLRAPLSGPAQVGEQLTVQVKALQNGIPQLQVIAAAARAPDPGASLQAARQQQQPLPPLFALLQRLHGPEAKARFEQLPTTVQERIQTLWRALPDSVQVQRPGSLKQAMQNSGPFLQSTLWQMAQQPSTRHYPALDLQTSLLRLASAIRAQLDTPASALASASTTVRTNAANTATASPTAALSSPLAQTDTAEPAVAAKSATPTPAAAGNEANKPHPVVPQAQARATVTLPPTTEAILEQLLGQTEAGLARILTHQLQSLTQEPQRAGWLLELPVRHEDGVDIFDMRIHRDGKEQGASAPAHHNWTVMLAFDLEGLGSIHVQISLVQELVSTYWWAEHAQTVELFHQHLDTLRNRMNAAGLQVNRLDCQPGIPRVDQPPQTLPVSDAYLDERI